MWTPIEMGDLTPLKTEPISDIDIKFEPIEGLDTDVEIPNPSKSNSTSSRTTEPYDQNDYPNLEPKEESPCPTETKENSDGKSNIPENLPPGWGRCGCGCGIAYPTVWPPVVWDSWDSSSVDVGSIFH